MNKQIMEMISYSNDGILSKKVVKQSNLDVDLFSMAAGTEIGNHTAKKDAFVYVIEGQGTFILNGEEINMMPGTFIKMNKDEVHSLKAKENMSFLLTLVGEEK